MTKKKPRRFRYFLDVEHNSGRYGVRGFKDWDNRGAALSNAESFARNNPDLIVSVRVQALDPVLSLKS